MDRLRKAMGYLSQGSQPGYEQDTSKIEVHVIITKPIC